MSAHTTVRTGQGDPAPDLRARPAAHGTAKDGASHEDGLHAALVGLSLLSVDPLRLEEVLTGVAQLFRQAVPGADGAGLRLLQATPPHLVVGSTEPMRGLDAVQYRLLEGPCLAAEAETRTVLCDSLSAQQQLRPGPRRGVRHLDVQSVLSLPLLLADHVLGSISVYAHAQGAFTPQAVTAAERFVRSATVTVRIAQLFAEAQHMSSPWLIADPARQVIDQALGVIVSRTGCTPMNAFEQLHLASQRTRRTVGAVAAQTVDDAQEGHPGSASRSR